MTPNTRLVIGIVWLAFVGVFLAISCAWLRRLLLLHRRGQSTIARIMHCQLEQSGEGAAWFSTLAFADTRGAKISVRRSLSTAKFQEGQNVRIIYDPEWPDRLRVAGDSEVEYLFGFLVLTLAQAGGALFVVFKA